jgi:hypothetical protein
MDVCYRVGGALMNRVHRVNGRASGEVGKLATPLASRAKVMEKAGIGCDPYLMSISAYGFLTMTSYRGRIPCIGH